MQKEITHVEQNKVKGPLTASNADPFNLYIEAVQDPEEVVAFINRLYQKHNGILPQKIREDFCGTAINCVEWIKSNDIGTGIAVDINSEPLDWCRENLLSELELTTTKRIELIEGDVRTVKTSTVDAILGLNSSIFYFKNRKYLLQYLQNSHNHLSSEGIIILEICGGPEAMITGTDRLEFDYFTAIWEQESFNAVTHETLTHLHFEFPDGSRIDQAFTYDWRLWSTSEIIDAMEETEFKDIEVYYLQDTPEFRKSDPSVPSRFVEVTDHWAAYIVGRV